MDLENEKYDICEHSGCAFFVEPNPSYEITDSSDGFVIAEYIHLDDGEHEHDHDAKPLNKPWPLWKWRELWPALFREYPDGKIGPNSIHFDIDGD